MTLAGPDLPQPYTITGGPSTNDPSRFRAPRINLFRLLARALGAIRKQLGLRLDKTADVPVHVIVVESIEKLPTPN